MASLHQTYHFQWQTILKVTPPSIPAVNAMRWLKHCCMHFFQCYPVHRVLPGEVGSDCRGSGCELLSPERHPPGLRLPRHRQCSYVCYYAWGKQPVLWFGDLIGYVKSFINVGLILSAVTTVREWWMVDQNIIWSTSGLCHKLQPKRCCQVRNHYIGLGLNQAVSPPPPSLLFTKCQGEVV